MSALRTQAEAVANSSWKTTLIPAFILGPPLLAVLVWVAVAFALDAFGWTAPNSETLRLVGFAHLIAAVVGSALGGLQITAPVATRVAVGFASGVYGGATFYGLILLADFLLLR